MHARARLYVVVAFLACRRETALESEFLGILGFYSTEEPFCVRGLGLVRFRFKPDPTAFDEQRPERRAECCAVAFAIPRSLPGKGTHVPVDALKQQRQYAANTAVVAAAVVGRDCRRTVSARDHRIRAI